MCCAAFCALASAFSNDGEKGGSDSWQFAREIELKMGGWRLGEPAKNEAWQWQVSRIYTRYRKPRLADLLPSLCRFLVYFGGVFNCLNKFNVPKLPEQNLLGLTGWWPSVLGLHEWRLMGLNKLYWDWLCKDCMKINRTDNTVCVLGLIVRRPSVEDWIN